MEQMERICELLDQEKECFLSYEAETLAIAVDTVEEIEEHMRLRTQKQAQIEQLILEIEDVCGEDERGRTLQNVVQNRCVRGELSAEYLPLFDRGMAIRAIVLRLREVEPQALERMTAARDSFLEKIKSVNQGNSAAASRYYRSTAPKASEGRGATFKKV